MNKIAQLEHIVSKMKKLALLITQTMAQQLVAYEILKKLQILGKKKK